MSKRCKYSDKETGACSCEKYYKDKDGAYHCIMEHYTTDNCNMKRKSKVWRVKAWAIIRDEHEIEAITPQPKHFKNAYIPCTILIDEKYLKEAA